MSDLVMLVPGHSGPREAGAAGEREWAIRLCGLIHQRLDDAGVASLVCLSWLNTAVPAVVREPARAMFVAHYDGAIQGATGYWGDISRRHHDSPSLLLLAAWESTYAALGLPYTPHRRTRNTGWFYGWQGTHLATPRIIVEHGFGAGDDYDLLHNQLSRVADLDTEALLLFLGEGRPRADELEGLRATLATVEAERDRFRSELAPKEWQKSAYQARLQEAIGALNRTEGHLSADDNALRQELNQWYAGFVVNWWDRYKAQS